MTYLSLCRLLVGALCCACLSGLPAPALANTPEEWVELGQQVHGGFGSYIALGIRIGLDARERLNAQPRELDVTYYNDATAPCPCVADGVMIATIATPGQSSLRVATEPSPAETFGVVEIRHKVTGEGLRYTIPDSAQGLLDNWNATLNDRERYDTVMAESESVLFSIESLPFSIPQSVCPFTRDKIVTLPFSGSIIQYSIQYSATPRTKYADRFS